jgi:hypothetical protein
MLSFIVILLHMDSSILLKNFVYILQKDSPISLKDFLYGSFLSLFSYYFSCLFYPVLNKTQSTWHPRYYLIHWAKDYFMSDGCLSFIHVNQFIQNLTPISPIPLIPDQLFPINNRWIDSFRAGLLFFCS